MKTIEITQFKCDICGHVYGTAAAANKCERKAVSQDKSVKVGDIVLITKGEGAGEKAEVTDRFIYSMEWGHYAWERYWHTVGINAKVIDSWGSRQLSFDSYEPMKNGSGVVPPLLK